MTTAIVFLVLFAVILWAFLIGTAKEDQGGEERRLSWLQRWEFNPLTRGYGPREL